MMTKKKVVIIITLVAWTLATGWLLRYEAFPGFFTHTVAGYKEMFSGDVLMSDSWMMITFNDSPIGFSHTSMEVDENDPLFYYIVKNEMQLKMPLMGEQHEVDVDTTASLDIMHQLQKFTFSMSSRASDAEYKKNNLLTMKAIRRKEDLFSAVIITPSSTKRTTMKIPADTVIHSPMTEMALKKLKPGQSMSIRTLEPTTFSTTMMSVTAIKKEPLIIGTNSYDATLLSSDYQGVSVRSWIDMDGAILKQETPFGWNMVRCTPEEALNAVIDDSSVDILRAMSVPCKGAITDPRNSLRLKMKLSGVTFTREELSSPRQAVETITDDETIITTLTSTKEYSQDDESVLNNEVKDSDLNATIYIQSDDKRMRDRARKITKDLANPADKASAIFQWVHKNVEKKMTVSLPSALDVLNTMSGDCNEHTYLFVGLARAAGLPAKVKVGLAYHENGFYYHAWPAVYTDHWIEMDPTWGQKYADATHIAFTEGEISEQLAIIKLLGQLQIEILDSSY